MSFLAKISLPYSAREVFEACTPEKYEELRKSLRCLGLPATQEELKNWYQYSEVIADDQEINLLSELDVQVTLHRVKGIASYPDIDGEKNTSITKIFNQVSVPNVGLMQVTHVCVREDYCTDALQGDLNKGWRILAVCPPNDARRPTYILGRFDQPEEE